VNGRGSFVLMAVDVMNEENGPLMVVPGSGRQGHQYLKQNPSPLDALFDGRAQPVLMEQGSVLLLGPYTVHGSKPNRSKPKHAAGARIFALVHFICPVARD
jgi:ectoine hydroxylase-related dioxygenase (phytanoyl-CoA dioxygenase family)